MIWAALRDLTYSAVWSLFLQASNNHKTIKQILEPT